VPAVDDLGDANLIVKTGSILANVHRFRLEPNQWGTNGAVEQLMAIEYARPILQITTDATVLDHIDAVCHLFPSSAR
jgi:hypothetical protein